MTKTFLSALSLAALLPLSAVADSISGTYDNTLDTLYAVSQPGSRAPDGDSYCKETFANSSAAPSAAPTTSTPRP